MSFKIMQFVHYFTFTEQRQLCHNVNTVFIEYMFYESNITLYQRNNMQNRMQNFYFLLIIKKMLTIVIVLPF